MVGTLLDKIVKVGNPLRTDLAGQMIEALIVPMTGAPGALNQSKTASKRRPTKK